MDYRENSWTDMTKNKKQDVFNGVKESIIHFISKQYPNEIYDIWNEF